jgi:hypothetical protein
MVKYRLVVKKRTENSEKLLPEIENLDCGIKSVQFNFDGEHDAATYEVAPADVIQFEDLISVNSNVISFKRIL